MSDDRPATGWQSWKVEMISARSLGYEGFRSVACGRPGLKLRKHSPIRGLIGSVASVVRRSLKCVDKHAFKSPPEHYLGHDSNWPNLIRGTQDSGWQLCPLSPQGTFSSTWRVIHCSKTVWSICLVLHTSKPMRPS